MDLADLTLNQASALISHRQISPVELTRLTLKRIDRLDPRINAYITLTADLALQHAARAERLVQDRTSLADHPASALIGIPLALKDLYETRGVATTAGSIFFRGHIPDSNAALVDRLLADGMVLLGKLNMHEIALGVTNVNPHFGACHNPWDLERISGGSSGGSAAALATGTCLASLGSDTGGSIRIPASLCGIVGLKPTCGRLSLRGVIPLSWNLDHAGPMGRCVLDVAILLQRLAGYDPHDPASRDVAVDDYLAEITAGVRGWRVVLASDEFFTKVTSPEVTRAVREAALVFQQLGAIVEEREFPGARQAARANGLVTISDAAAYHRTRLQDQPQGFGEDVLRRLRNGAETSLSDYILARRAQSELRRQFERFFQDCDLLLTPTTPITAPLIQGPDAVEQARLLPRFTAPFNLTGLPAMSIPCGFTTRGLPIGLQIVARPWAEAHLLRAGYAYERATQWHTSVSPIATA